MKITMHNEFGEYQKLVRRHTFPNNDIIEITTSIEREEFIISLKNLCGSKGRKLSNTQRFFIHEIESAINPNQKNAAQLSQYVNYNRLNILSTWNRMTSFQCDASLKAEICCMIVEMFAPLYLAIAISKIQATPTKNYKTAGKKTKYVGDYSCEFTRKIYTKTFLKKVLGKHIRGRLSLRKKDLFITGSKTPYCTVYYVDTGHGFSKIIIGRKIDQGDVIKTDFNYEDHKKWHKS